MKVDSLFISFDDISPVEKMIVVHNTTREVRLKNKIKCYWNIENKEIEIQNELNVVWKNDIMYAGKPRPDVKRFIIIHCFATLHLRILVKGNRYTAQYN